MTDGKVLLVTGGAQGIGRAIAAHLLSAGWSVAHVDADAEEGREKERDLSRGGQILFVHADVGVAADVERAVDLVVARFGRLDALANNAGISGRKPFSTLTLDDWNRVLAVNLTATFLFSRHAADALRRARGAIVNIDSTRALM